MYSVLLLDLSSPVLSLGTGLPTSIVNVVPVTVGYYRLSVGDSSYAYSSSSRDGGVTCGVVVGWCCRRARVVVGAGVVVRQAARNFIARHTNQSCLGRADQESEATTTAGTSKLITPLLFRYALFSPAGHLPRMNSRIDILISNTITEATPLLKKGASVPNTNLDYSSINMAIINTTPSGKLHKSFILNSILYWVEIYVRKFCDVISEKRKNKSEVIMPLSTFKN
jgi:hypothetical protein